MRALSVLFLILTFLLTIPQLALAEPAVEVGEEFKLTPNSFGNSWRDSVDSQIFEIDFGDGSEVIRGGHQGEITHTYAADGLYVIKVRPIDIDPEGMGSNEPSGPWVEIGQLAVVIAHTAPKAQIVTDMNSAMTGEDINFDGTNSSASYPIFNYAWDFGDGTTAEGRQVTHSYARPGGYTATLTVTDELDATDEEAVDVTIASEEMPADEPAEEESSQIDSDTLAAPAEPAVVEEAEESPSADGSPVALILGIVVAAAIALGLALRFWRQSKV